MGRFRNKHICRGWMLSQFSECKKSYWLTVPPGSNLLAIGSVLCSLPGGSSKMITIDAFEATEIYFRTDLRFNDVFKVIINELGLEYTPEPNEKYPQNRRKKPVLQYSITGEFMKEWVSTSTAARETGVNVGNISLCCRGKYHQAGGFVWKYKNN